MEKSELLKKVRAIEIKTRGLSSHIFSGEYHSAFKGRGMSFSEVRDYQPGDDVRAIEWNVTARFNHPYVKVYEEERELTVFLLVDVSASQNFGTARQFKKDLVTEICAVLSFSALQNNDKIGVLFFSDKIEKFIPPKKGKSHVLRIISDLLDFKPQSKGTDLNLALRFFNNAVKKKCICFLLSDFVNIDPDESALRIAAKRHDLVALRVFDEKEQFLPNMGIVQVEDAETKQVKYLDTADIDTRLAWEKQVKLNGLRLKNLFSRLGIDLAALPTNRDYVPGLIHLFKNRGKRIAQ